MNTPTGAGDYQQPHYPYPYVPYGAPFMPLQEYGTTTWTTAPVTEERIREIIREELTKALEALKEQK